MKKKGKRVKLSHTFWKSYKLFLKGEITMEKLKKNFEIPNDIVFFKEECDRGCNILTELEKLEKKKLNNLICALLIAVEGLEKEQRKALFKKVLMIFLGNYSCFATGKVKKKTKDIMLHLSTTIGDVPINDLLNKRGLEMMYLFVSSRNLVEDKEAFIRPIIHKLICLYIALVVSDQTGAIMCQALGKKLFFRWNKSTPEQVTLSILMKLEKNSKLSPIESQLLDKYSCWIKKRNHSFLWFRFSYNI